MRFVGRLLDVLEFSFFRGRLMLPSILSRPRLGMTLWGDLCCIKLLGKDFRQRRSKCSAVCHLRCASSFLDRLIAPSSLAILQMMPSPRVTSTSRCHLLASSVRVWSMHCSWESKSSCWQASELEACSHFHWGGYFNMKGHLS